MRTFKLVERLAHPSFVVDSEAVGHLIDDDVSGATESLGTLAQCVKAFDGILDLLAQVIARLKFTNLRVEHLHDVRLAAEERNVLT